MSRRYAPVRPEPADAGSRRQRKVLMKLFRFLGLGGFILLAGCAAVGPDYQAPALPAPVARRARHHHAEHPAQAGLLHLAVPLA